MSFNLWEHLSAQWNTWQLLSREGRCSIAPLIPLMQWMLMLAASSQRAAATAPESLALVSLVTRVTNGQQRLRVCQVFWHLTRNHKLPEKRLRGSKLNTTYQLSCLFLYSIPDVEFHSPQSNSSLQERKAAAVDSMTQLEDTTWHGTNGLIHSVSEVMTTALEETRTLRYAVQKS